MAIPVRAFTEPLKMIDAGSLKKGRAFKRTHNTLFLSIAERDRKSGMPRLLAFPKVLGDEREGGLGHFTPPVVNDQ